MGIAERVVVRSAGIRALAWGGLFVWFAAGAIAWTIDRSVRSGDADAPVWMLVVFALGALIGVAASVLLMRVALIVDHEGVVVRNWFTTRRLAWADIEAVELNWSGRVGRTTGRTPSGPTRGARFMRKGSSEWLTAEATSHIVTGRSKSELERLLGDRAAIYGLRFEVRG